MPEERVEAEQYEPPRIEERAGIALPLIGRLSEAVCMVSRPN
jgi:hypothetical protein